MIDLYNIKDPSFIKELTPKELKELASQIRTFLIENISNTGGHLSSNLGVVELTIAMYYVFDHTKDKFLFDVGHQSYVHKILTGRAKDFTTLRKYNGLSGYINKTESAYDVWESGHSSTSISAMAGMILADDDKTRKYISIIGDSSITNGVAMEGLNFVGSLKNLSPIIILNDNKMGISKSVGSMVQIFSKLRGTNFWRAFKRVLNRISPRFICNLTHKIKRSFKALIQYDNIFEDMGFDYYGPIDGHNIKDSIKALQIIKDNKEPVIVHFTTIKGKGYDYSEIDENGSFHGVSPFDIETGKSKRKKAFNEFSYSYIVANYLCNKRKAQQFYVVTPAMKAGAELEEFANLYPSDFFDVGIAEEHAAVMGAGIALQNKRVVLLYYSTFAQRAYDYFLNDIARQNLNIIIGIDRSGVVGEDGSTHQGIYDISMFSAMPNVWITMPKDGREMFGIFNYAFTHNGPIVIRYPRKSEIIDLTKLDINYIINPSWEVLKKGSKVIIISYGPDVIRLSEILEKLDVTIVNARFIKPMDKKCLVELCKSNLPILIFEQVINSGSLYNQIVTYANENNFHNKIENVSFNVDTILPHGSIFDILDNYGMSDNDILEKVNCLINKE